jgi:ferric-dicitrate binding protein FerR (iron transport regulator)
VSAERVAQQVQAEMKTEMMTTAERSTRLKDAAASISGPRSPGRVSTARPEPEATAATAPVPARSRRWMLGGLLLVLLGGAGGWYFLAAGPVLVVENRLVEPIRIVVENRTVEIAPSARTKRSGVR